MFSVSLLDSKNYEAHVYARVYAHVHVLENALVYAHESAGYQTPHKSLAKG